MNQACTAVAEITLNSWTWSNLVDIDTRKKNLEKIFFLTRILNILVRSNKRPHCRSLDSTGATDLPRGACSGVKIQLFFCLFSISIGLRLSVVTWCGAWWPDDQMTWGFIWLPLFRFIELKELNIFFSVGTFCKKLWRKLVKVEGDLKTIAGFLEEYHLASQAVEIIMRTVQEMVNIPVYFVASRQPRWLYCANWRLYEFE